MTASLRGRLVPLALSALLVPAPLPAASPPQRRVPEPLLVGVTDLPQAIASLHAQGVAVRHVIEISNALAVVGDRTSLRALPFVRYVEPDPPDAVWTQEDTLGYGIDRIDAEVVWGGVQQATNVISGQGGLAVKVAVVDTGIDCTHADLVPGCYYGANFVTADPPFDDHGHGTHVAGIIAARDNGIGIIGTAPEADLYAVKVLGATGSGSWSAVAAGIDWAVQNGMQVINMSLGGASFSQAVADAVAAAAAAGVLVVSAAGNSGCCNTVSYPAKYPGSMAVAAVDPSDLRASFSSTGPELDVAAPGVSVISTVPTGACGLCDPSGYRSLSGTSMATPHVSGVAALLISRGWTSGDAWAVMNSTARDLGDPGFDQSYGYGRIDAAAAVTGTPVPPPPPPPPDTTAPTAAVTSPMDGAAVARRSTVTISAYASDDVGVSRVDFYVNGSLKCAATPAPYTCAWKVPPPTNKSYQLEAWARDAAGNVGRSAVVTVTSQ